MLLILCIINGLHWEFLNNFRFCFEIYLRGRACKREHELRVEKRGRSWFPAGTGSPTESLIPGPQNLSRQYTHNRLSHAGAPITVLLQKNGLLGFFLNYYNTFQNHFIRNWLTIEKQRTKSLSWSINHQWQSKIY